MQISRRLRNINQGGSDGWEVFTRAREMKAAGLPVVELTVGEHDIPTDPEILRAMYQAGLDGHVGYQNFQGQPALRERVAERVERSTGTPTAPEEILIVPGGQAGLFATHNLTCDPGDTALYIDPYYATYPGTIRSVGAVAKPVTARAEDGFQPDPDAIDAAAEGAKSLLVNSPNNPTGVVYSRDTMEGIARVCRDRDLWLISDEVYDTQVWEGDHLSPRALPDMAERTLVIGSMSKSHAMTGSRIGWVVGPREAISYMGDLTTNTTYGVAGFVQMAAVHALDMGPAFEAEIAAPFRRRRGVVMRALEGQNVVRAIPTKGAMYVMLDLRATGMSGEDFAMALLDTHHVAVMPGESFGRAAAGHVRVALTVADERLEEAMRKLVAFAAGRVR
ncbi:pyridoxal phosphate-dependent aminotransferase [Roseovarius spongiae]|uniref:Aminotransferase n=1 Tax=Roseovarius spongiae TaxID=2320272 RepID=A0A3A8B7V3_9RHOB|nr:pyridoxal phosphate-dependent aminotransferase [Roseovarius spongiae]RKF13007.1 pyridoxal phosphate-dependent aminotransferase [Roseovarius spongiae]